MQGRGGLAAWALLALAAIAAAAAANASPLAAAALAAGGSEPQHGRHLLAPAKVGVKAALFVIAIDPSCTLKYNNKHNTSETLEVSARLPACRAAAASACTAAHPLMPGAGPPLAPTATRAVHQHHGGGHVESVRGAAGWLARPAAQPTHWLQQCGPGHTLILMTL